VSAHAVPPPPPEDFEDECNLGQCCGCHGTKNVRTVVMMHKRGPVPGTGWGCVVCGLPADGAISVICDSCVEAQVEITEVCCGYAKDNRRVPIRNLSPEPFDHDMRKHAEDDLLFA
jgi:hypothetical protein